MPAPQNHYAQSPHPSFLRWLPDDQSSASPHDLDQLERSLTMQHHAQTSYPNTSLNQRAAEQSYVPPYSNQTSASPSPQPQQQPYNQQVHQPHIPPQHVGMSTDIPEHQLERLVNRVAHKLLETINNDRFLDKFLNTRELLEDNKTLASQIQQLLRDKKQLEQDVQQAQSAMNGFKRIVGNIYLKMD